MHKEAAPNILPSPDSTSLKTSRDTPSHLEVIAPAGTGTNTLDPGCRTRHGAEERYPWWLWPHLWSLDAPLVAVVWQRWLARSSRVPLSWQREVVLALAVWLIYVADRWVDGRSNRAVRPETARHVFSGRHRGVVGSLIVVLLVTLVTVTPWWLTGEEFLTGLGVLALSTLYFWMTHGARGATWMSLLPKEAAVGALFAVGAAAFVAPPRQINTGEFLLEVVGFAALCSLNCASITRWERTQSDLHNRSSLLNAFPKLVRCLPTLSGVLALLALACSGVVRSTAFLPLAGSAGLLGWLDQRRASIPGNALRVLADLALLTPLLFGWS